MARRPSDVLVAALSVLLASIAGLAAGPSASGQDAGPRDLLERIGEAEGASYRARQLVVYFEPPQSAAVLDVRSEAGRTFVRAESAGGDDVTRVWRRAGRGLVAEEGIAIEDLAPPSVPLDVGGVLAKYAVEMGEPTQQLGVEVVPLELVRRADRRLVERLWVEPSNGVVYRRELLDATGSLLGLSQMLEMHWGEPGEAAELAEEGPKAMVRESVSAGAPDDLPYGYELVKGSAFDVEDRATEHWVYSDGLHTLSVFRSRGPMDHPDGYEEVELDRGTVWAGPGPGTWTWEGEGSTWVLVAEEPQLDVAELAEPFPMGGRSFWSRLGSWWAKAWGVVAGLF